MKFRHLFNKKKKIVEESPVSIVVEIEKSIEELQETINSLQKEKDELTKSAIEIIHKIFVVPNQYWYEEFSSYEQIKEYEENKDISEEVIAKTDHVIASLKKQVQLRDSKIEFYIELIKNYKETLIEARKQNKIILKSQEEQKNLEELEKLNSTLEDMEFDSQQLNKTVDNLSKYEQIKEELKEQENQIEMNRKIVKEINQLTQKINSSTDYDILNYRVKIELLIEELKKR